MNGFRVNTPLASSNSLRLLGQSQAKMESAIQRLSSGLRINSARDDTAGSAISQRMQNQIRGQRMASNNIKQGTDLVQTAEGGLGEIQGILSRMRELAVQAASDNLNANDRFSIDLEYQQLKEEVNRIANSTNYNSMNLLDGSRGGSNGVGSTQGSTGSSGTGGTGEITNIIDLVDSSHGLDNPYGLTIHNDQIYWNDQSTDKIQRADLDGSDITDLVDSSAGLDHPLGLIIHNNQIYWTDNNIDKIQRADLDGSNVTDLVDSSAGLDIPIDLTIHNDQIYWTDKGTSKIQRADLNLASGDLGDGTSDFTIQIGANNSTNDRMTFGIDSVTTDSLLLADTDVDSLSDAQTTINSLDAAIDFINDQRSNLGAVQNRLGFADSNLMSSIQNTESSLSTIRDADFAIEASNLARTQILTQSGTAMLAQANQISQNILSLLK